MTFDLYEYFPKTVVPTQVLFYLKRTDNFAINIYLLDKNDASKRSLKSQLLAYDGPTVTSRNMMVSKKERFILKFNQIKHSEADKSNGCQEYPNKRFETFGDCDKQYVYKQMKDEGVMPFWATDNIKEVTSLR